MDHLWYCAALGPEIVRFADVAAGVDPQTPVPTCPGWTMGRLVRHAGSVHRWAGHMVRELSPERVPPKAITLELPDDPQAYPDWLAAGAGPLVETLRATDPDASMWAWGPDRHARFWSRRMLFETIVHRADAELAVDLEPKVDPAVAADGVDELLVNLPGAAYFAPAVAELRGSGETIHLHATDTTDAAGEWMVRLDPDGFAWEHGHGKGTVAVRGSAADLLLLVWGRRRADDPERFEVFGDRGVLDHWVRCSAL